MNILKCNDCKFIAHYTSGPYARNPHHCCELMWFINNEDYRVDPDKMDGRCPLVELSKEFEDKKCIDCIHFINHSIRGVKGLNGDMKNGCKMIYCLTGNDHEVKDPNVIDKDCPFIKYKKERIE